MRDEFLDAELLLEADAVRFGAEEAARMRATRRGHEYLAHDERPPLTISILFCSRCGRDDRLNPFTGKEPLPPRTALLRYAEEARLRPPHRRSMRGRKR